MATRTNISPAAASSITVADWSVESAERGRGERDAVRDTSLVELVLKEITDALGRGDTVRLSCSGFESEALEFVTNRKQLLDAGANTGKSDRVSHREMVFRPQPRAGKEMAEPAQHAIRRNSADPLPETDNYDVVQS